MNREIKFRGRRHKGDWYYGSLDLTEREPKICFKDTITDTDSGEVRPFVRRVAVDDETIGQYIGIKDCNGNDVYEGDIVRLVTRGAKTEVYSQVAYTEADTAFCFTSKTSGGTYMPISLLCCVEDNILFDSEVVGNIYDNSEMLNITTD